MFKVKLIIPVITVALLMTVVNSYSLEAAAINSSRSELNQIVNDLDPKKDLFKLCESQQTEFENTTLIKFELGEEANVLLTVCDSEGKVIATLIDDTMEAGIYNVNYKSDDKITAGELTYKLEVKGVSGIKNIFAVK